jgi:hypothetical protein
VQCAEHQRAAGDGDEDTRGRGQDRGHERRTARCAERLGRGEQQAWARTPIPNAPTSRRIAGVGRRSVT